VLETPIYGSGDACILADANAIFQIVVLLRFSNLKCMQMRWSPLGELKTLPQRAYSNSDLLG